MISGRGHRALCPDVGPEGRAGAGADSAARTSTRRSRRSSSPVRRLPRTSRRCSGRRLPTRRTKRASAATSTSCSSRRATPNQGPSAKRVRPAPMGRAFRVLKRTAHLTVHVSERPEKVVAVGTSGTEAPRPKRGARPEVGDDPVEKRFTEGEGVTVGQKVHPIGFRLGFNKTWRSRWYSDRDYAKLLHEDLALRSTLKKRFAHAGVSKIETRARGQPAEDRHLHLAPRDHHRPQGHGSRQAEAGDPEEDQPRGLHQHPGDPEAGARRAAHLRIGGDAAREARRVPPGDAQGGRIGAALRRPRHQGPRLRPPERRRDRAFGVVPCTASCRCRRCAPTSTTASRKPTRPTARSGSRCGSTRRTPGTRSAAGKKSTGNARRADRRHAHRSGNRVIW